MTHPSVHILGPVYKDNILITSFYLSWDKAESSWTPKALHQAVTLSRTALSHWDIPESKANPFFTKIRRTQTKLSQKELKLCVFAKKGPNKQNCCVSGFNPILVLCILYICMYVCIIFPDMIVRLWCIYLEKVFSQLNIVLKYSIREFPVFCKDFKVRFVSKIN